MIPMNIITALMQGNRTESREIFEKIKESDYIQEQKNAMQKPELGLYRIKKYNFSKVKIK